MPDTFFVHVHGVSFQNNDKSSRQELVARCRSGDNLVLRAEPQNPYDRHAVAVLNSSMQQLGYLPSDARDSSALLRGEPITEYSEALQAILALNNADLVAAAHRYRSAPINRLSLLLEKSKRYEEALSTIIRWLTVRDPIGLPKGEAEAVSKRKARLQKALANRKGNPVD